MGTLAIVLGVIGGIAALLVLGAFGLWLWIQSMKNWN